MFMILVFFYRADSMQNDQQNFMWYDDTLSYIIQQIEA